MKRLRTTLPSSSFAGSHLGISSTTRLASSKSSKAVYTLTGVKMAESSANLKSLPRGIYVIGNKKVLVK
ncbi:MAG: hypothetical protein IJL35_07230 [Bacteroidaceae bacterium]|nr:hypothetical protein [Bacteroidaceae bacterium]